MASVTSLDADMRKLRLGRYTPAAANETRTFIEDALGETLSPGDLLEALKDGVVLCKLANLVLPPPGIKYKKSGMPFIQMENISHFLKACEMPPLNMPAHDRFLTVDLFEGKDPAQVLQCISAFSRQAHAANPTRFPSTVGPKKSGVISPNSTGSNYVTNGTPASWRTTPTARASSPNKPTMARAMSPALTGGSTGSQNSTKSPSVTSSWSRKKDEGGTVPAWNIHQYGYMGGASQGNQGISFGARRQITSQAPSVPSLAEKDRIRREKQAEETRRQQQTQEDEERARVEQEEEEERQREEERHHQREEERRHLEDQKRRWDEEEQKWREEEEAKLKEEVSSPASSMLKKPPNKPRVSSSSILRGQSLSQYQLEQNGTQNDEPTETPEQARVRELEKQLEEAKERERLYQAEREERLHQNRESTSRPSTATERPRSGRESEASWIPDEREHLPQQWQNSRENTPAKVVPPASITRPLIGSALPQSANDLASREPSAQQLPGRSQVLQVDGPESLLNTQHSGSAATPVSLNDLTRVLPTPATRVDRFLSANTAPIQTPPRISSSQEAGITAQEQAADRDRRVAGQQKTKAGGWAGKSLLEREMERERERQREWEAAQQESKAVKPDASQGIGEGQTWDVNQYGYMGGDNMNKGSSSGSGIAFGGRRQIIGPRPQK